MFVSKLSSLPNRRRRVASALLALLLGVPLLSCKAEKTSYKFDFGPGAVAEGYIGIDPDTRYSSEVGYGFMDSATPEGAGDAAQDALKGDACVANGSFTFAVDVPEGNYNVAILLGSPNGEARTTVKVQARRLMLEAVATDAGEFKSERFTVNIRSPRISEDVSVSINSREKGPPMIGHWDERLMIEFLGDPAAVAALHVESAPEAVTLFIAGDSTVTDQRNEPWAGWGQMLPAFFKSGVAVSNHAESGRALYSFRGEKRLDKILSMMQPGDYLFIQFGHNDQKNKSEGAGPFTTYKEDLKEYIELAREKGGIPVLVTPMERRRWSGGQPGETLADFAEAVRRVGEEERVPVIDLHAMSLEFYAALGESGSKGAFVHYPANAFPGREKALSDNTHHNVYGAHQLARAVVEGIRAEVPALATHLREGVAPFDPSNPDAPEDIDIPVSPLFEAETPEGD